MVAIKNKQAENLCKLRQPCVKYKNGIQCVVKNLKFFKCCHYCDEKDCPVQCYNSIDKCNCYFPTALAAFESDYYGLMTRKARNQKRKQDSWP